MYILIKNHIGEGCFHSWVWQNCF